MFKPLSFFAAAVAGVSLFWASPLEAAAKNSKPAKKSTKVAKQKNVSHKNKKKAAVVDAKKATEQIDQLILENLKANKLKPNADIDDTVFLRRAYLDIAGRIPTIEEFEAFTGSTYENKRERLIADLLESDAYTSHNYNYWADILRINRALGNGASQGEAAYQLWLKESITDNKPYDQMVRELVSAQGQIWDNGAVGYYLRDRGMPLDNMSNTVRIFLGTRLECAQCHNHPFDKWTQMDYYHMAAFSYGMNANGGYDNENRSAMRDYVNKMRMEKYSKAVGSESFPRFYREQDMERYIEREKSRDRFAGRLEKMGMTEKQFVSTAKKGIKAVETTAKEYNRIRSAETELYNAIRYISAGERKRDLKLPHDYQYDDAKPHDVVQASTMFGEEIELEKVGDSAIDEYVEWMTSKENPTFTKVIANRLWKKVFGRGVFEPIDEITDNMKVSNPKLMAYLEKLMRDLDYDTKAYMAILYNTNAYQRAADSREIVLGEPYHFPGPLLRRMTAEQIWDSIVSLALPEADSYRPRLKTQLTSVNRARLIYESLTELSEKEYIAMVKELGAVISRILPRQEKVREELYAAREKEDEALYRKKREELGKLQQEMRKAVTEIGHKKLHQEATGEELLASIGMSEMDMEKMTGGSSSNDSSTVLTKLPKPEMPEPPADLDKKQISKWKKNLSYEFRGYTSLVARMARASELESPAPRGHFLREFGQSDREVIENAASNASVPQALNLLNSSMVEALTNKFAVFGSRLYNAEEAEEKAKLIFQGMLTREPTEDEMLVVKNEIEQHGAEAYEGIVWALLNTQQFIFVQ